MGAQIVKKTFSVPGATTGQGKSPKQIAGEITSFFTRSNFNVASRGDTVTYVLFLDCAIFNWWKQ